MKNFRKITFLLALIASYTSLFAQTDLIREERKVSSFSSVKASGIADVYLSSGSAEKVEVEVNNKEYNDRLKIEVQNNELIIRFDNKDGQNWGNKFRDVKVKVYITYKKLNGLKGSGATNFTSRNLISADNFSLDLSGANNSTLELKAKELEIEMSGAANITLSGKADRVEIETSGAANAKAYKLLAQDVKASSSGASNIYVNAEKTLEARASGVSNINYHGSPQILAKEVSKMANLNKRKN